MFRYSLDLPQAADRIDAAVAEVLEQGHRTADIASEGLHQVGCQAMGELVLAQLAK